MSLDGTPVSATDLGSMCAAMRHRGPDDEGIHVDGEVGLGMRRLSIIDLAGGHQPICNEDGRVWAVLNGEIYNYRELRADLERRGHRFATASDTETIVHLYEDEGRRCVERLRGMFAFAVWDAPKRTLLVARDRLGIKPLYFASTGARLCFASELKALCALRDIPRRVDPAALNHLLAFLTTPADRSILAGVRKLEPAHLFVAEPGRAPRIERYWDVHFAPDTRSSPAELEAELVHRLEEATRMHMVSDVPVGAFLSGGIDSSTVVAMMARASSRPVKTFSVGFAEPDFDELGYARLVARAFGTEHHEMVLEPDVLPSLEDLVWHLDEPFGDSSAIPTYLVSKMAGAEVRVVLSGDGGDELFAGYERYLVEKRERRFDPLPRAVHRLSGQVSAALPSWARGRRLLGHHALVGSERYLDAGTLFSLRERRRLIGSDLVATLDADEPARLATALMRPGAHWLSALQEFDLHAYLPLDILTKVDRMSMAHSIEARVPLLDHELVELCARIPPSLQLRGTTSKYLLKRAMRGVLPESILRRPKQGFAVPLGRWFRGKLHDVARDVLLCDTARQRGFLEPDAVREVLDAPLRGRDLDLHTWTLLDFELWCRQYLDGAGRAPSHAATPAVTLPASA
ncbi:MAG: asparagine synthase (glutamine-hydrolyzing) [Polyangiaceae bacterium]|nr:asparagine synthase (glutamine-hydrolyzing) [Polyangiaceae bacterium]